MSEATPVNRPVGDISDFFESNLFDSAPFC